MVGCLDRSRANRSDRGSLLLVTWLLADMAGGFTVVIDHAAKNNKFQLFPSGGSAEWWAFIGAFVTFAFGSIPQQDVFQRVTSAKDEPTAIRGTLFGGLFYFAFAFIPMFIAYSAVIIDPAGSMFDSEDERFIQKILPNLILNQTPLWTQVLFFGALLSAILSTASGALLAPSSLFTENVLRPLTRHLSDKQVLWTVRVVLLVFSVAAAIVAVNSQATMYKMVQNAYKVTLVGAFVPLAFGVLWKRATTQGAVFSIALGFGVWVPLEVIYWDADPDRGPGAVVWLGSFLLGNDCRKPATTMDRRQKDSSRCRSRRRSSTKTLHHRALVTAVEGAWVVSYFSFATLRCSSAFLRMCSSTR